ncbi:tachykinin-like peptides receptor 86C [Trichonephila clavipes]|nr:tachykinin-like peptides receptor 86C [Trichonephila clavipes]
MWTPQKKEQRVLWYNIVFLIVTYIIPMSCMTVTYTWIGCILWGSKVIGENTDPQNHVIKSKQKVVHMLVAIMLLFAICWLPYHIYFLYTYYNTDILYTHFIQHVYLAIYWLAMSNSCYNPIVYYIMNARFRSYFQEVLCIHRKSSKPAAAVGVGATARSLPLMAKASIITSNRARSCRMNQPETIREWDANYFGKETSEDHEAAI